jgi:glutamate carboxypeptidase
MAEALRAFERTAAALNIGWTVVLNPDEEIGSPSSTPLLHELAREHDVGLVYEPALPDGSLAGTRGGSGTFDLVLRGRSAHVGRAFDEGRSAMHLAGEVVALLANFNQADGVTVNVGRIDGGGPVNQVADVAVVRLNVRVADAEKQQAIENDLRRLVTVLNRRDGFAAELHGDFLSPPKPMTPATQTLFDRVKTCGDRLGLDITWNATGGCCDGNKLQAVGLPTVDTLGVRGGGLHSDQEFVLLDSLVERTKLSVTLLHDLATND